MNYGISLTHYVSYSGAVHGPPHGDDGRRREEAGENDPNLASKWYSVPLCCGGGQMRGKNEDRVTANLASSR